MRSFKILGLLLTYPEQTVIDAGDTMKQILHEENLLPPRTLKALSAFLQERQDTDLITLQEEYVATFDRGRAHCLHLFEHIHGESRDRGQAMVNLAETYAGKGLHIGRNELPDYLPLFLEYLSFCSLPEATELLGEAISVIALIGTRLKKNHSPYRTVFGAIEALSAVKPNRQQIEHALANAPKDPETLEALDEQWKEANAFDTFSPNGCQGCESLSTPAPTPAPAHARQQTTGGML